MPSNLPNQEILEPGCHEGRAWLVVIITRLRPPPYTEAEDRSAGGKGGVSLARKILPIGR
jgi:hypothetical protein